MHKWPELSTTVSTWIGCTQRAFVWNVPFGGLARLIEVSTFIDYQSYLNSSIGYVFINLSHSLDGKPLLGASSDLVSVRRGPGDCLGFVHSC